MTDDEKAIRSLVETWMSATKAGDIETILSLMTDDVVFTVVGQEPFGKEAFREVSEQMKDMRVEGTNKIKEISIQNGWAYMRNYIEVMVTVPNADPVQHSGYTLTILRKGPEGQWRIARDANLVTANR